MKSTKLSLTQVCSSIDSIYSGAKLCKHNANWIISEFKKLLDELNSRSSCGARRYPVFIAQYAKGYDMALHNQLWRNEVEFCYVVEGIIYSTHKDSCHENAEALYVKLTTVKVDLNKVERGHYWKNSSVKFA